MGEEEKEEVKRKRKKKKKKKKRGLKLDTSNAKRKSGERAQQTNGRSEVN